MDSRVESKRGRRDLQGGELLVERGLVALELRGVVLGRLAPGRAPLLLLPRAVPHRSGQPERKREQGGGRSPSPAGANGSGGGRRWVGLERGDLRSLAAVAWRRAEARFCRAGFGIDGGASTRLQRDCRVGPGRLLEVAARFSGVFSRDSGWGT